MNEIQNRLNSLLNIIPEVNEFVVTIQNRDSFSIRKKGTIDIVTEADTGAEKIIINFIQKNFPEDSILGEESGLIEGRNNYKWIIDPVDGTTNYANRLPLYAVAIAIENISTGNIVMGVVSLPAFHEVYHATLGGGAYKNKKEIHVSQTSQMIDSLLCTGFPYNVKDKVERVSSILSNYLLKVRGVRRTGSACLDLCWLAEGRFDGFWEENLKPWDTAAASIIILEAGGTISTYNGSKFNPYCNTILASNSLIHASMLNELKRFLDV